MGWVEALIEDYAVGRSKLEKYKEKLRDHDPNDRETAELSIVNGMISDIDFAVTWMGRYKGERRRISKPTRIDRRLFPSLDIERERHLTEERREEMLRLLSELSRREQQCLLLYAAYGLSYAEIGKELGVTKAMVQQSINRAKDKIVKFF